ncbi:hypothetical protein IAT38_005678 [Cryptococcus sp. DSM 104549]
MKEGDGYNTAEAGPSRMPYNPQRAWSADELLATTRPEPPVQSSGSTDNGEGLGGEDQREAGEDEEEVLREEEALALEDTIPAQPTRPSLPSNPSSHLLPPINPSQATPRRKTPHLTIDLPLHTSASEIFGSLPPSQGEDRPNRRPTTYSSLPPSPRGGGGSEFLGRDLDVDGLREGLGGLEGKTGQANGERQEAEDDEDCGDGDQTEIDEAEEFWPARSRRPTVGEEEKHPLPRTVSLDSPVSPISPGAEELGQEGKTTSASEGEAVPLAQVVPPLRMWDLLKDEMGSEDWDGWIADGKWERISNFLAVPLAVEKTTLFGALLCLDGFLYNFTVLPIRALFALGRIFSALREGRAWRPIPTAHLHSILRMLLLVIPTGVLLVGTDASKMYHTVRGQDTIKLYVIFNALEIADRLCCAFGQDVLDTLFARETLSPSVRKHGKGRKRQQARPVFFFALSLGYVLAHSVIFFYMLVSLNVAINSYDYTLLSLLISNQFVEIKGSVFKKFEKENLFQIMCADIVERFQLSLMLSVIAIRNMIEMSGSDIAFLPKSFFIRGKSLVDSILSPVLFVIVSEMMVDWLKHAFITKFNHVRASVYERFTDVLAKDVLLAGSSGGGGGRRRLRGRNHQVLLDQSPLVARRLGFASIPLACLVIRISAQALGMLTTSHHDGGEVSGAAGPGVGGWTWNEWAWLGFKWGSWVGVGVCAWGCLVFLKVILGLSLLSFSAMRQEGMEEREAADTVNDFGRAAVGESKEETEYNKQTSRYLSHPEDDIPAYPSLAATKVSLRDEGSVPFPKGRSGDARAGAEAVDSKGSGVLGVSEAGVGAGGGSGGGGGKKGKKWKLEEVERWTMVKRIW